MKVETHNHPTAISPYPGAATGVGGEIRDEGATGRGAKPRAGLSGFSVSNLNIPGFIQPWEVARACRRRHKPSTANRSASHPACRSCWKGRSAAPHSTMNSGGPTWPAIFARSSTCGGRNARLSQADHARGRHRTYRARHAFKEEFPVGRTADSAGRTGHADRLGGGAASSMDTGTNAAEPRFRFGAARQRRRWSGARRKSSIAAGRWKGAATQPDPVDSRCRRGRLVECPARIAPWCRPRGIFNLRDDSVEEPGMSPCRSGATKRRSAMCLRSAPDSLELFRAICERERCPFAVVGRATVEEQLVVDDPVFDNRPVDMDLSVLLGKPPKMIRDVTHVMKRCRPFDTADLNLREARIPRAAVARGGGQDVSHQYWRPQRRRHDRARPDGGAVAGAGRGCGRDPDGIQRLIAAKLLPWASVRLWR